MAMTVSRTARPVPTARIAANDEPYSTIRWRSRSYQTRCGIPCADG